MVFKDPRVSYDPELSENSKDKSIKGPMGLQDPKGF